MPQGKTASKLSLGERRAEALELFTQGHSVTSVAKKLNVTKDTASRYRRFYEQRIQQEAAANPQLLNKTLENTLRTLEENDRIRRELWDLYEEGEMGDTNRVAIMDKLLKAGEQRAKLLNLFGVKSEYFVMVNSVKTVQDRLIEFMRAQLCPTDRAALETLLMGELAEHMGSLQGIPTLPLGAIDASSNVA